MKARNLTLLTGIAVGLLVSASLLRAQVLQVDINGNGDTTAAGWIGWDPVNPNNSALDTGIGTFAAPFATDGTVDVRIITSGNTYERNYGVDVVTGSFSAATPAELWQDQYFFNQVAGGPMVVTLDDLQAGPYSFTIYNYYDNLNTSGHAGGGTAITDIFVNGVDSGVDATAYGGTDTVYAAAFLEANAAATVNFNVASDNDTVTLDYRNPTTPHFGLNGFLLAVAGPDNTPPTLVGTDPSDETLDVPITTNLVATFDEPVEIATGDIIIKNLTDATDVVITLPGPDPDGNASVSGAELTIDPAVNLDAGDDYAILIAADAVEDASMNPFTGILVEETWNFTTAPPDNTAPALIGTIPVADATDLPINSDLMLTFDESVLADAGSITIHLAGDGSVVKIINVASVTIDGGEVTITPGNLDFDTTHYVNIAAGAFTDFAGNPFPGIGDMTTWRFTTAANPIQDSDLMVDFSRIDQGGVEPLQLGWQGFTLPATGGAQKMETFSSPAIGNDGTVTVSIQGNTHSRDYAPATGQFEPLDSLLRDGPLMNAAGTTILTLSGLRPGAFEMTTFHHTTQFGPSERTANPFDVTLDDAVGIGQAVAQGVLMSDNASDSLSTLTFEFVSDGTNPVIVRFTKFSGGDHFALPGFQLSALGSLAITDILYSPNDNMLTLTWTSRPGASYGVFFSTDMIDWSADLNDSISADPGDTTTETFDLSLFELQDITDLFFQVEEN